MFGIWYLNDPEKWDIYNFSYDRDIEQKAYIYDMGSGDQSTSLRGIGSSLHRTCI